MPDDRFKAAYEATVEDVAKAEAHLTDKKKVANTMANLYGVEPPYPDADTAAAAVGTMVLKADQFANYGSPSEAARAFLKMRGEEKGAASLDVIYEALMRGGFTFSSIKNDPRGGLRIALGKDTMAHKLPNNFYGLLEWYPTIRREKERKRAAKTGSLPGVDGPVDDEAEASEPTPTPAPTTTDDTPTKEGALK